MIDKIYYCCVSGNIIPPERVAALRELGTPERDWACVEYADKLVKRRQAIYDPETGILHQCDNVRDEAVTFEKVEHLERHIEE